MVTHATQQSDVEHEMFVLHERLRYALHNVMNVALEILYREPDFATRTAMIRLLGTCAFALEIVKESKDE